MQSASSEESKRALAVVVLAAGLGTRMKSKTPKVLHELCGRPMVSWVSDAVEAVSPDRALYVLGRGAEEVHQLLPQSAEVVIQEEQLGTGDAIRSCQEALEGFSGDIMVLCGDAPLMTGEALRELYEAHDRAAPACTLMTVEVDDPGHYGRIVRDADARVRAIIEARDASDEQRLIKEINAGTYVFEAPSLLESLARISSQNDQGEFYLTDVIEIMTSQGQVALAHMVDDSSVAIGVNSRVDLAAAAEIMRRRILERHMLEGVTIIDPASTYIDAGVKIGEDTVVEPMSVLAGDTVIGDDCVIGPSSTVVDTVIEDGVNLVSSHVTGAEIASGCNVGPFAYLRPGARLEARSKAGTFVEIKNSRIGEGTKVPHLSYVGDAEIGSGTNIGAGNITANYDGIEKHRTIIGSGVHTGAGTVFVAPVEVGDGSMTGAGSVINKDVPEGDLGIARCRQENKKDYASKRFASRKKGGKGKG